MECKTSQNTFDNRRNLKIDQELVNLVDDDSFDPSMKKRSKIRFMYIAAFTSLMLAIPMGLAVGYSAPATYDMEFRANSAVKPTKSEITWIGSMLAVGATIGGIFAGTLADKIGRKDTLMLNLIPFSAGWITICYARSVPVIILGRLICGMACGVVSVTIPMYCVEIATADVRGILGSAFQGFQVFGNLLSVIIGAYVTWEYLALMGAISVIVGTVCFFPMPESPRWLLANDRMNEAISVMDKLQNGSVDATSECNSIYDDLKKQPKGQLSFKECKHPTVYKPAFIAFTLMFFQQFSGANAVLFYSSSIFQITKGFLDPKKATIVICAVQVIVTFTSNLIVDKVGRKILLLLSGIFMALSLILLGTYYYISSRDASFGSNYSWIPLVSVILFILAFSVGFGPIPWLLASEMVPVRARSAVSGLATFSNGFFAFIVTKTFSEIQDLAGIFGTFWFYSVFSIIGTVFVIFMVPETKGKKLEEIEGIFQNKEANRNERIISISVIS